MSGIGAELVLYAAALACAVAGVGLGAWFGARTGSNELRALREEGTRARSAADLASDVFQRALSERVEDRLGEFTRAMKGFADDIDDGLQRVERKRAAVSAATHREKKAEPEPEPAPPPEPQTPDEYRKALWNVDMFGRRAQ